MPEKLLYQSTNSLANHFRVDIFSDFNHCLHIHRDLEFIYVTAGEIDIITDGRTEVARTGDLALVLPNQKHAFITHTHSQVVICTFAESFASDFVQHMKGLIGERSVFPAGAGLSAYLMECYLSDVALDHLTQKATVCAICARYLQCIPVTDAPPRHDDLLHKLLQYVEDNYRENITLHSASQSLGYDENYLSRFFHRSVGINFRRFVNQYRIEYACDLMNHPPVCMADIALSSGFQNIRSFNRAFRDIMGTAPSDYLR